MAPRGYTKTQWREVRAKGGDQKKITALKKDPCTRQRQTASGREGRRDKTSSGLDGRNEWAESKCMDSNNQGKTSTQAK